MKILIVLVVLILQLNANSLKVYIKNILLDKEDIGLILYNLRMEEQSGVFLDSENKNTSYVFKNLKTKRYIIIAFQDTNMNGFLDSNEKYIRKYRNIVNTNTNTETTINMKNINKRNLL